VAERLGHRLNVAQAVHAGYRERTLRVEGAYAMERVTDLGSDRSGLAAPDPCAYVRQADLALLYGSREEAVALIAQAYLAFDLVLADSDAVTDSGRPGRSS
jgi:hypothetical protein